jgi:hypothetical protein
MLQDCEQAPDNFVQMTNILFSLSDNLLRQERFFEVREVAERLLAIARAKG